MSAANVELQRRWLAAFNARDVEAFVACCHPDVEYHSVFAAVDRAVYSSQDGVRQWWRDVDDAWDEIRIQDEVLFDLGEHVLVYAVLRGRGRQSGADVALPYASVATVRDGLAVYFKTYTDGAEARRDLGVTEDELEPIAP